MGRARPLPAVARIPAPASLPLPPGADSLAVLGEPSLLAAAREPSGRAFFCSVRCPAALILAAYDQAQRWQAAGVAVVSGFHTPVEKTALGVLLAGRGPVVICPARAIDNLRVPAAWRTPLAEGRLLVVSPFGPQEKRANQRNADVRNALAAALAAQVFVAYAAPGGKTEALALELLAQGRRVAAFASEHNQALIDAGAEPVAPEGEGLTPISRTPICNGQIYGKLT